MSNDPIEIIEKDHKAVEDLFEEYEGLEEDAESEKRDIADRIIKELKDHTEMEETFCYPRFKDAFDDEGDTMVEEAYIEHEAAKNLLADLSALQAYEPKFDANMKVLMEQIRHHVKEEEDELLPKAKRTISEEAFEAMGAEMNEFKASRTVTPR
jgi:hemerythrin-like domain-containing protein